MKSSTYDVVIGIDSAEFIRDDLVCESDLATVESMVEAARTEHRLLSSSDRSHSMANRGVSNGPRRNIVLSSIHELVQLKDSMNESDNYCVFVSSEGGDRVLHQSESRIVGKNESMSFFYHIHSCRERKFTALTITVVFLGIFFGSKYVPADISVEFKQVNRNDDISLDSERKINRSVSRPDDNLIFLDPMVSSLHYDVQVRDNTKDQMGTVVIHYGESDTTIEDGLYELLVTAREHTSFSVALRGSFATDASVEVKMELARFIQHKREARRCSWHASSIVPTIQLLRRKLELEEKRLHQASSQCEECENQIEKLDVQLDERDNMEDGGAAIVQRMQGIEVEYKHWRALLDSRSKMVTELKRNLDETSNERVGLLDKSESLQQLVVETSSVLSKAVSVLWGEPVSLILMDQLGRSDCLAPENVDG